MDAVEFAKTLRKICRSHTSCVECEFVKVQGHCGITNPEADHAGMVAVAEQWAREHVEKGTEEESRNLLELMVALTDKVDRLEEKIKVAEKMIEESRCVTDATFGEVDERFAEVKALLREKEEWAAEQEQQKAEQERQKAEQKRTNKDVLLAAFPRMVMAGDIPALCPRIMDRDIHIQHCAGRSCEQCRHEYWLSEAEE